MARFPDVDHVLPLYKFVVVICALLSAPPAPNAAVLVPPPAPRLVAVPSAPEEDHVEPLNKSVVVIGLPAGHPPATTAADAVPALQALRPRAVVNEPVPDHVLPLKI